MKRLTLALLGALSLSACAQAPAPTATAAKPGAQAKPVAASGRTGLSRRHPGGARPRGAAPAQFAAQDRPHRRRAAAGLPRGHRRRPGGVCQRRRQVPDAGQAVRHRGQEGSRRSEHEQAARRIAEDHPGSATGSCSRRRTPSTRWPCSPTSNAATAASCTARSPSTTAGHRGANTSPSRAWAWPARTSRRWCRCGAPQPAGRP